LIKTNLRTSRYFCGLRTKSESVREDLVCRTVGTVLRAVWTVSAVASVIKALR
jgi:hypothetical protein